MNTAHSNGSDKTVRMTVGAGGVLEGVFVGLSGVLPGVLVGVLPGVLVGLPVGFCASILREVTSKTATDKSAMGMNTLFFCTIVITSVAHYTKHQNSYQ